MLITLMRKHSWRRCEEIKRGGVKVRKKVRFKDDRRDGKKGGGGGTKLKYSTLQVLKGRKKTQIQLMH